MNDSHFIYAHSMCAAFSCVGLSPVRGWCRFSWCTLYGHRYTAPSVAMLSTVKWNLTRFIIRVFFLFVPLWFHLFASVLFLCVCFVQCKTDFSKRLTHWNKNKKKRHVLIPMNENSSSRITLNTIWQCCVWKFVVQPKDGTERKKKYIWKKRWT